MRKIRLAIIFVLAVGCLTGCASDAKKYDTNTIIVKKSGAVEEVAVEDYSDSSVKAEDLKTYIEEQITAYNDENGKNAVKRQSLNTEDMSKAKLLLSYKSMNDFNEFNSLECSFADVADVKESDLSGSYKSAEDNKSLPDSFQDPLTSQYRTASNMQTTQDQYLAHRRTLTPSVRTLWYGM